MCLHFLLTPQEWAGNDENTHFKEGSLSRDRTFIYLDVASFHQDFFLEQFEVSSNVEQKVERFDFQTEESLTVVPAMKVYRFRFKIFCLGSLDNLGRSIHNNRKLHAVVLNSFKGNS